MNKYLRLGINGYECKTITIDEDIKPEELASALAGTNSQRYGAEWERYIRKHCEMHISPPKKNRGDGYVYSKSEKYNLEKDLYEVMKHTRYFEIKTSYADLKTNSTFAILRIKPTQKLDYYILCLVEPVIVPEEKDPVNYLAYFYCLPAEYIEKSEDMKRYACVGTEEANENNDNIELRITIKKEEAFEKFGKYNISRGTSFKDLQDCVKMIGNDEKSEEASIKSTGIMEFYDEICGSNNPIESSLRSSYRKDPKFALLVNGEIIEGKNNINTLIQFCNKLGPFASKAFFPPSHLGQKMNEKRCVRLSVGNYYFNPDISIKDVKKFLKRGMRNTPFTVNLIER